MRGTCWLILLSAVLWAGGARMAHGQVWTPMGPGGGSIIALVIDPATPTTLYAGTADKVFKSIDGGATWQAASAGLPDAAVRALAVDPTAPSTLYAGTDSTGVFKSLDGGATWQAASSGLTDPVVRALALDPATPTTLYAGTDAGVFKSLDGGATWQAASMGLTDLGITALAISPATPATLYAATLSAGVFTTTDGGATWQAASAGLTHLRVLTLALAVTAPTTLYAGTDGGSAFALTTALGLVLSGPSPCRTGTSNTLEVIRAAPSAMIYFAYGLHAGTTPIPACTEQVTIGGAKLIGHAVADENGNASFRASVPAAAGGRTILFQAVDQASCTVSTMTLCTFPQ
jgi:photosystem II stability/assembly factor-like uncharacterized protein